MAPGLWVQIVSSAAEPPHVEGGRVPPDVGVPGSQLVYTQGQPGVCTDHRVIMEPDLGPGDGTLPGLGRCQVLLEPHWALALMLHYVLCVFGLVLQRVQRHVLVLWHHRSH